MLNQQKASLHVCKSTSERAGGRVGYCRAAIADAGHFVEWILRALQAQPGDGRTGATDLAQHYGEQFLSDKPGCEGVFT